VLTSAEKPRDAPTGVGGASVRTIEHHEIAALVSDVDDAQLNAPREVRAHWAVLEQAAETATVVPARFGTILESDSAVRERLLAANADQLTALLAQLAGRVQLSLQGVYEEEPLLQDVVRGSQAVAAQRERVRALPDEAGYFERIRLGELVSQEVARHRAHDAEHALARLEPLADAVQAEEPRRPESAFNLAFLVARDSIDAFSAGVAELTEELAGRVRVRYVGPLPPYSFVDVDLSAGEAAWA
jgi:hypothetical protein